MGTVLFYTLTWKVCHFCPALLHPKQKPLRSLRWDKAARSTASLRRTRPCCWNAAVFFDSSLRRSTLPRERSTAPRPPYSSTGSWEKTKVLLMFVSSRKVADALICALLLLFCHTYCSQGHNDLACSCTKCFVVIPKINVQTSIIRCIWKLKLKGIMNVFVFEQCLSEQHVSAKRWHFFIVCFCMKVSICFWRGSHCCSQMPLYWCSSESWRPCTGRDMRCCVTSRRRSTTVNTLWISAGCACSLVSSPDILYLLLSWYSLELSKLKQLVPSKAPKNNQLLVFQNLRAGMRSLSWYLGRSWT